MLVVLIKPYLILPWKPNFNFVFGTKYAKNVRTFISI